MKAAAKLKDRIAEARFRDEAAAVADCLEALTLSPEARRRICAEATKLVESLRRMSDPGIMEQFLTSYGLSTEEGVALMCLAEAYLRTPDAPTVDALIRDKIGSSNWRSHLGENDSFLVNASTWALMLTGQVLGDAGMDERELTGFMAQAVRRLGEPVVRVAIEQAMKILGRQFVLGASIADALKRAEGMEEKGYRYSYDMLGEAARTAADARRYFLSYSAAISAIADRAGHDDVIENPGISVKLSALHPRYEFVQRKSVLDELVPRVSALAEHARSAGICLTVDAEEADRLELSADVIEAVLRNPDLAGWDGFGVVVQAYAKQAPVVLDWLYSLAGALGRRITVRLVKGAYWDQEIKNAQVLGLENYPVFTRKASTDASYLRCVQQLLGQTDRIYPQFATHNAHTACAVLELAGDFEGYEFQRLHGMGEALHELLRKKSGRHCRIYAPVGVHKDLLAYLVRRLLENGANSSFVHQLLNDSVPAADIVGDPVAAIAGLGDPASPRIPLPPRLYGASRRNSKGVNLNNPIMAGELDRAMAPFRRARWSAAPSLGLGDGSPRTVVSPADRDDVVGEVVEADGAVVGDALERAERAFPSWRDRPVEERARILERVADLYEENMAELIAIASREAGKTRLDGILEVREAVDFCRYYAAEARRLMSPGDRGARVGLGPFVCISPWNFPLAIFTGQITAALAAGNAVLSKPAEQTPLMAARAVALMHEAGVPEDALILLPGDGATVGAALTSDPRVTGVCFTGSTETALLIDRALARHAAPDAPLIAETGGLNAMIVDSTALPEQAVRDIVASAFQSAGQRCSALRVLLVQEEIESTLLEMLEGAARELRIGRTWDPATDVGPVIDEEARAVIAAHCEALDARGRRLFQVPLPAEAAKGIFVSPAAYRLEALEELEREIFGPVLHVCRFASEELDDVVDRIDASGYGLTLGIHSRVGERVDRICARARVGNIYVNRNQIGAVVGVQPFGGEGLSGTGPKAGGPHYLHRFTKPRDAAGLRVAVPAGVPSGDGAANGAPGPELERWLARARLAQLAWDVRANRLEKLEAMTQALPPEMGEAVRDALGRAAALGPASVELSGPTGEQNTLLLHGRGIVLCLGGSGTDGGASPDAGAALAVQAALALALGNAVLLAEDRDPAAVAQIFDACNRAGIPRGVIFSTTGEAEDLTRLSEVSAVAFQGDHEAVARLRVVAAERPGPRLPVIETLDDPERFITERVISVDTTASGGNATLLAQMEQDA